MNLFGLHRTRSSFDVEPHAHPASNPAVCNCACLLLVKHCLNDESRVGNSCEAKLGGVHATCCRSQRCSDRIVSPFLCLLFLLLGLLDMCCACACMVALLLCCAASLFRKRSDDFLFPQCPSLVSHTQRLITSAATTTRHHRSVASPQCPRPRPAASTPEAEGVHADECDAEPRNGVAPSPQPRAHLQ